MAIRERRIQEKVTCERRAHVSLNKIERTILTKRTRKWHAPWATAHHFHLDAANRCMVVNQLGALNVRTHVMGRERKRKGRYIQHM